MYFGILRRKGDGRLAEKINVRCIVNINNNTRPYVWTFVDG